MFNWLRRATTPTIHIDEVKWFYLVPTRTEVVRGADGKSEIFITLRGQYDFEYTHERCWTKHKLYCTVDGVETSRFDDNMVSTILKWMYQRYISAHSD